MRFSGFGSYFVLVAHIPYEIPTLHSHIEDSRGNVK
jgi:hypothetical protein